MTEKNIQIPYSLFKEIFLFVAHVGMYELEPDDEKIRRSIEDRLLHKIDKLARHDAYTEARYGSDPEGKRLASYQRLTSVIKENAGD